MLIGFEAKLLNRMWTGRSNEGRCLTVTCREITLFRCSLRACRRQSTDAGIAWHRLAPDVTQLCYFMPPRTLSLGT